MTTVWDPLRRKEVALTPEEKVRQWFITVLRTQFRVPEHQMMSEVELHYGAGKVYRADILIYGKAGVPLAIIECKRPEVTLSQATFRQAMRYNMVLGVPFLFITNGNSTFVARRTGDSFSLLDTFPDYQMMLDMANE